jgi:hypothetical protein
MYRSAQGIIIVNNLANPSSEEYITQLHDSILRVKRVTVVPTYIVDFASTAMESTTSNLTPGEPFCSVCAIGCVVGDHPHLP